jgi:hypothetical protein
MASRKEQKERLRRERLAREQAAREAERRKRLMGYGAGGLLAAAAIVGIVIVIAAGGGDGATPGGDFPEGSVPQERITDLQEAAKAAGCRLRSVRSEGRNHTDQPVAYKTNPPTTGPHNPVPAEDGAYLEAPPTESLVHSLEHGRIVIWFKPNVPDSVKGDLKALFDEDPYHLLLTPNRTQMPYQVAATAWSRDPAPNGSGQLLACPKVNDRVFDALKAFKEEHRDNGPEAVP